MTTNSQIIVMVVGSVKTMGFDGRACRKHVHISTLLATEMESLQH